MPSTAELQAATYKRGTKVRLVDDLPSHPAGSQGKVALANGMTWKRYWVRFADGTSVGHVDHESLVRAKDYDLFVVARDREAIEAEEAATKAAELAEAGGGDDAGADGGGALAAGGGATINGVFIAQSWLDKAAAARARILG
ncbi:MAG: hypothetical protein AAF081_04460 [Actinomycetota bacterium]